MELGSLEVLSHRIFETKCVTQVLKVDVSNARVRCATALEQDRFASDGLFHVDGSPPKSVPRKSARSKLRKKWVQGIESSSPFFKTFGSFPKVSTTNDHDS